MAIHKGRPSSLESLLFYKPTSRSQPQGDKLVRNADERYELEKKQWASEHPEATPAQYSAAMLEIARRCGV